MSVLIENVLEVYWKAPVNPSQDWADKACARHGYAHSLYLEFCTSENTHHWHINNVGTLMSFPRWPVWATRAKWQIWKPCSPGLKSGMHSCNLGRDWGRRMAKESSKSTRDTWGPGSQETTWGVKPLPLQDGLASLQCFFSSASKGADKIFRNLG